MTGMDPEGEAPNLTQLNQALVTVLTFEELEDQGEEDCAFFLTFSNPRTFINSYMDREIVRYTVFP